MDAAPETTKMIHAAPENCYLTRICISKHCSRPIDCIEPRPSSTPPPTPTKPFLPTPTTTPTTTTTTTTPRTPPPDSSSTETALWVLTAMVLVFGVVFVVGAYIYYVRNYKPIGRAESIELPLVVPPPPDVNVERRILLSDLPGTVEKLFAQGHIGMTREYAELKSINTATPTWNALHPDNKYKNRYFNILPYDETRVMLKEYPRVPGSDFINASYIHGYSVAREFIACQGPLEHTVDDFWRMVWEKNVHVIVMVTQCIEGHKDKCSQYWPDLDQSFTVKAGTLTIKTTQEQKDSTGGFLHRRLQLSKGMQRMKSRLVHHFHFTSWPDMGCPTTPDQLINFVKVVKTTTPTENSHMVVHCSAGVGRTGTFIALSNLMEELHDQTSVDIFHAVYRMRLNRTNMVQTEAQYAFLYKCVLKYYLDESGKGDAWPAIRRRLENKDNIPDVIPGTLKEAIKIAEEGEEDEEEEEVEELVEL